jgi:sulfite oxidase
MSTRIERSLSELYQEDPERADAVAFGRVSGPNRRGFLGGAGLAAMGAAVGGAIPFSHNMPAGLAPAALAQEGAKAAPGKRESFKFPGKDPGLSLLGDRPLVAETPEHLMNDDTTPISKFFIRNNGQMPEAPAKDADSWKFVIDGEVNNPIEMTLGDLKKRFQQVTYRMVLECGGNGRSFFQPTTRGNPWTNGGAGCAEWTGVPLADVLRAAGLNSRAVYTAHYGRDPHLSGDPKRDSISRGMPIAKAMEQHSLLVWAMNGQPLPEIHGGPLRLLIPGWPGSLSHKWLSRIWIRDREHDGSGMTGTSYRVAIQPMVPGGKTDPNNFKILESMPVRGIISNPENGTRYPAGTRAIALRGAAWDGDVGISRVDVSIDFGATWTQAAMERTRNRYDWNRWTAAVALPTDGYYEVWVRATDNDGRMQPHIAGNWNPQGYGANPMHRVAILVG